MPTDGALCVPQERRSAERLRKAQEKSSKRGSAGVALTRPGKRSKSVASTAQAETPRVDSAAAARALAKLAPARHVHSFLPDEMYDATTDMWTKRCECGFAVEYEKM